LYSDKPILVTAISLFYQHQGLDAALVLGRENEAILALKPAFNEQNSKFAHFDVALARKMMWLLAAPAPAAPQLQFWHQLCSSGCSSGLGHSQNSGREHFYF
jgi:hypothetical protein